MSMLTTLEQSSPADSLPGSLATLKLASTLRSLRTATRINCEPRADLLRRLNQEKEVYINILASQQTTRGGPSISLLFAENELAVREGSCAKWYIWRSWPGYGPSPCPLMIE